MDSSIDPFIPHPGFFIFGLHFADGKAVIQALLKPKMEGAASGRPTENRVIFILLVRRTLNRLFSLDFDLLHNKGEHFVLPDI